MTFLLTLNLVLTNIMRSVFFFICFCAISLYSAFIAGAVFFQAHDIFITYNVAAANFIVGIASLISITCLGACYAGLTDK